MNSNQPNQQPRNTPIIPLAQEIPQYRQAKLAGRNFLGPIRNMASRWSQLNANLPYLSDNGNTMIKGQPSYPTPTTDTPVKEIPLQPKQSFKPTTPLVQTINSSGDLSDRSAQLSEKLRTKDNELKALKDKTQQQQQTLSTLNNQQKATDAVIQNLKQQLSNMEQNNIEGNETNELKQKISAKEQETNSLRAEIEKLNQTLSESERVAKQIEVYRNQIKALLDQQKYLQNAMSKSETQLSQLKSKLDQETKEKMERENQIKRLEKLLEEAAHNTQSSSTPQNVVVAQLNESPNIPTMTKDPNAISGIVTDKGGKFITDAVVLIKNIAGQNLRALKTNQLGQFVATTSLPNGKYFIQTSKAGHSFDTVEISLTGGVVPPVQIQSHELTA